MANIDKLRLYINKQLNEIKENACANFKMNSENRKHNVFNAFNDHDMKKYMGLGRSFDSQLGNKLQNIAMLCARMRYGMRNVPNIITMKYLNGSIVVETASISIDDYSRQLLFRIDSDKGIRDLLMSKKSYKNWLERADLEIYSDVLVRSYDENAARQLLSKIKPKGTPIDLFFLTIENNQKVVSSFEIKSGGNLDTKNSISNLDEVRTLKDIFSVFDVSNATFATCYSNLGDGVLPQGDIFRKIQNAGLEVDLGKQFWEKILPEDISYDDFVRVYLEVFETINIENSFMEL